MNNDENIYGSTENPLNDTNMPNKKNQDDIQENGKENSNDASTVEDYMQNEKKALPSKDDNNETLMPNNKRAVSTSIIQNQHFDHCKPAKLTEFDHSEETENKI